MTCLRNKTCGRIREDTVWKNYPLYGDKNPVVDKSQFVLSLYERITDDRCVIGPKEKRILDRCVEHVYSRKHQYEIPTFFTLRRVLQEQDEPEAKYLALMLELFTDGTLNNFSHPTNIKTKNCLISFSTRGMVEDMKELDDLDKQKALYQLMSKLNEAEISIRGEGTVSADDMEAELGLQG